MLTFTPGSTSFTPKAINRYPIANRKRPIACFFTELGSIPFLPKKDHRPANIGANTTNIIGLNDWKYAAGISHPPILRSVCSSAKKVSDAPACSYAAQKNITKKAIT